MMCTGEDLEIRSRSNQPEIATALESAKLRIGIGDYPFGSDMVGHLGTREVVSRARCSHREHFCIPRIPLLHEPLIDVFAAFLHVRAFQRIGDHFEQERVVEKLEAFPVSDPGAAWPEPLVAPETRALHDKHALPQI